MGAARVGRTVQHRTICRLRPGAVLIHTSQRLSLPVCQRGSSSGRDRFSGASGALAGASRRSAPRLRHERDRIQHKLLALDLWPFRVMKERALSNEWVTSCECLASFPQLTIRDESGSPYRLTKNCERRLISIRRKIYSLDIQFRRTLRVSHAARSGLIRCQILLRKSQLRP